MEKNVSIPIYFGVTVWGRTYCESFLQYCLASLLAEGNIPALENSTGKNCFLICTTAEDWAWLMQQPLIALLKQYMQVQFIQNSAITLEQYNTLNNALHSHKLYLMTLGHRSLVSKMYADKAIGSIIIPDSIYSNQAISSAFQYIIKGKMAVLVFCPRFSIDTLLLELKEKNYLNPGQPLTIPARELIALAINNLHIDMKMQAWENPDLPEFMFETSWELPDHIGKLFYTWTCWCSFINYSQLKTHQIDSLGNNTIDGIYFGANLTHSECHFINDSDEFTLISFSPDLPRRQTPLRVPQLFTPTKIAFAKKRILLSMHMQTDYFKLRFATTPIYMHVKNLTSDCYAMQNKTQFIIKKILSKKLSMLESVALFINTPDTWNKLKSKINHCIVPHIRPPTKKIYLINKSKGYINQIKYYVNKIKYHGCKWFLRRIIMEFIKPTTRLGHYFKLLSFPIYFLIVKPSNFLINLKKSKQLYLDSLSFFYDLEIEPITYDFVWALCTANAKRKALGLTRLRIILVPGTINGLRKETKEYEHVISSSARHWRIYSILIPTLELLDCPYHFTFCADRNEALFIRERQTYYLYPEQYNVMFPVSYSPKEAMMYGDKMLCLKATEAALNYISGWKAHYVGKKKLIVITLRQYGFSPARNSNMDAWLAFANKLEKEHFYIVFLPDTEVALTEAPIALSKFYFFYPAAWNLHLRAALYELAYLNLGVNTGPMSLCWFNSNCRYITFKTVTESVPQTSLQTMTERGFIHNQNPRFTNRFQKWVWDTDNYDIILQEFLLMCEYIEKG